MTDQISHLTVEYPDPNALPPSYDHDEVKMSTDYLRCLRTHALEILKLKLGKGVVDSTPVEYTLTIPAIFEDEAKDRFKTIASIAGMGHPDNIRLVSEPEAAAVFTLDAMDPHNLKKGDKFVLCDAGGGTVDLITYRIAEMHPKIVVKEAVAGDGDICGGTFLNRIFGKYLSENFDEDEDWEDDIQEDAMRSFEAAKREFTGDKPVVINVNGLPDDAGREIKRGRLTIPAAVVKARFEPIMALIISLIKKQLRAAKDAKAVLLVGGLVAACIFANVYNES
jgi:molecular chaperone DnaK (HSP70)